MSAQRDSGSDDVVIIFGVVVITAVLWAIALMF